MKEDSWTLKSFLWLFQINYINYLRVNNKMKVLIQKLTLNRIIKKSFY